MNQARIPLTVILFQPSVHRRVVGWQLLPHPIVDGVKNYQDNRNNYSYWCVWEEIVEGDYGWMEQSQG